MSVTIWPEGADSLEDGLNMANGNAAAVLGLLGVAGEDLWGGRWEAAELPGVRRAVLRLLNDPAARQGAAREPWEGRGPTRVVPGEGGVPEVRGGCRVFVGGLDDAGVADRLRRLDAVLAEAQREGRAVVWC